MIILTFINKIFINISKYDRKYIDNLLNKFNNYILYKYNSNYSYEYIKFKDYYISNFYSTFFNSTTYFNYSGKYHRENGPAYIQYYNNGEIWFVKYYLNDKEYSYKKYLKLVKKLV